jgi:hypothetical protein
MSSRPLHIVFSLSAADSLREGLATAARNEDVIGLGDDWSQGSVGSDDLTERLNRVEDVLEIDITKEDRAGIETFWQLALDGTRPRIVWLSQWSAMEYCGFLEWLRRNGGAAYILVDLTDTSLPDPRTPTICYAVQCVSLLIGKQFAENALWLSAAPPSSGRILYWAALWDGLRTENAPLRVITPSGLISAPIDHFDDQLLKHSTGDWVLDRHIVGQALVDIAFGSFRKRGVFQCGDLVLFARLRVLVKEGMLQGLGDPCERDFKVRKPGI